MNTRRYAAALAAVAVLGSAPAAMAADTTTSASSSAPAAASASPAPSPALPSGLFGLADPTYDGVWRQSLALLAEHTEGITPADEAVDWLAGQQCSDGAFPAYRADTAKPCDTKTLTDTNSTAAAVQALAALGGHDDVTAKAVEWLKSVQNDDGGWGYSAGSPSDANSTSVVIGALAAVHKEPSAVTKTGKDGKTGKSPYDALLKLALPCTGKDGGAFAYQPDKKGKLAANPDATAAAVIGALGKGLAGDNAAKAASAAPSCAAAKTPAQAAENGAAYLVGALGKNGGHLMSAMPGAEEQPDYGNTADTVVALVTAGHTEQAAATMKWLEGHATAWADASGPAAYAQLILAAHAQGADPHHFGDIDLVKSLTSAGPAPAKSAPAAMNEQPRKGSAADSANDDGGVGAWWIVGILAVVAVCVVIGLAISAGKRKQQS